MQITFRWITKGALVLASVASGACAEGNPSTAEGGEATVQTPVKTAVAPLQRNGGLVIPQDESCLHDRRFEENLRGQVVCKFTTPGAPVYFVRDRSQIDEGAHCSAVGVMLSSAQTSALLAAVSYMKDQEEDPTAGSAPCGRKPKKYDCQQGVELVEAAGAVALYPKPYAPGTLYRVDANVRTGLASKLADLAMLLRFDILRKAKHETYDLLCSEQVPQSGTSCESFRRRIDQTFGEGVFAAHQLVAGPNLCEFTSETGRQTCACKTVGHMPEDTLLTKDGWWKEYHAVAEQAVNKFEWDCEQIAGSR